MALSMVHLLLARSWARGHEAYLECPEFYLGAISPDAMHVRFHADKYWRERFTPFDVGYGIHALTDGYWVPSVKRDFPDFVDPARDALIPALYYNDVRQTDFRLYAEHPDRPRIFALLRQAVPPRDHPMLTAAELAQWRDDQFAFYEGPCPHDAPVRHVDSAYVEGFIDRMVPEFDRIMRRYFS